MTVNAIAPGFIQTRMMDDVPDKAIEAVLGMTPVGRLGEPMEIGAGVLYLASPVGRVRHRSRARHQRRNGDVTEPTRPSSRPARRSTRPPSLRPHGWRAGLGGTPGSSPLDPKPKSEDSWPALCSTLLVDQQKAAIDETQKMWQRFFSLPRVVEQARETKVGGTPHDVVYEEDTLKLLRYRRETPASTPSRSWSATRWSTAPTSSTSSPTRAWSASSWTAASTST